MSRKRTRRKIWSTQLNPITHALLGAAITPRHELDRLLMRELASLEALTHGQGALQEWHDMATVNNVAQTLACMGVGREVMPHCHLAEDALIEAAHRYQKTGKFGLTGQGIQALRDVIGYHDLQRASISRAEYERALKLTTARIASGHATIDLDATLVARELESA